MTHTHTQELSTLATAVQCAGQHLFRVVASSTMTTSQAAMSHDDQDLLHSSATRLKRPAILTVSQTLSFP